MKMVGKMAVKMKEVHGAAVEHRLDEIKGLNLHTCFKDFSEELKVHRKSKTSMP